MTENTLTHRKRPVAIEARQLGRDFDEDTKIMAWCDGVPIPAEHPSEADALFYIPTLEGRMVANRDDWVVRGVAGEFYPVKPDIFEATYEALRPAELVDEEMLDDQERAALRRFEPVGTTRSEPYPQAYIAAEELRARFRAAALAILLASGATKSRTVALTELETAMMWALRAFYGAPGEGDGA